MKLSQVVKGRDNNFNLLRIVAAYAVLVSHSFGLVSGKDIDPLTDRLGMDLGGIAVDIFFITSGLLVTNSLIARKSTLKFIWARFLRIYPALVVVVLLMVFGLGLFFTTDPASSYLGSGQTHDFVIRNITLLSGVRFQLPGVFKSIPTRGVVNGSIWTLVYELRMYAILAIMWPLLYVLGDLRMRVFGFLVVLFAVSGLSVRFVNYYYLHSVKHFDLIRLFYMFFAGAACFVLRERVTLSLNLFLLALLGLLASMLSKGLFFGVYNLVLAYLVFWVAYVPTGFIRRYNRLGDYSYGFYIYAFPIQQAIIALIPGVTVAGMMMLSTVATFFFAVLSWHLIEKRALSLKGAFARTPRQASAATSPAEVGAMSFGEEGKTSKL